MWHHSSRKNPGRALLVMLRIFLFLAITLGVGCSKKEPRYPEDHARFQRIVGAIKTLQTAYVKQDGSTIHDLLLPLDSLTKWEAAVRQDFSTFSDIQLDLTIERILIDEDGISAFVSWDGIWKRTSESPAYAARGHGTLLWSGTQVILLRGLEGDLPFGISVKPDFPT
ncbi:MAG: hypothetical protein R3351_04660 [Nitrospirales bacterium]|nr:hypothetical protein [Nitrospirales bacterium]